MTSTEKDYGHEDVMIYYDLSDEMYDSLREDVKDKLGAAMENEPAYNDLAARCERLEAEKAALRDALNMGVNFMADGLDGDEQEARIFNVMYATLASTTPNPLYAAAPRELKEGDIVFVKRVSDSMYFDEEEIGTISADKRRIHLRRAGKGYSLRKNGLYEAIGYGVGTSWLVHPDTRKPLTALARATRTAKEG